MTVSTELVLKAAAPSDVEVARGGPPRGLNALGGLSQHIVSVLQRNNANLAMLGVPPQPEPEDGLWEDVAVPQARARWNMWVNSIKDAAQDEYLDFRFSDLDANQHPENLRKWLASLLQAKEEGDRPSCLNWIMPGNIGSGKSASVCALGNEAAAMGLWTLYVKHSTYVTWLRPDMAPRNQKPWEIQKMFIGCDLLILDELCGEMDGTATEFTRRETINLIDARISAGRPTAYTTNLRSRRQPGSHAMGIVDVLGERLLSRLESSAHLAKVEGPDRRKPAKPLDW